MSGQPVRLQKQLSAHASPQFSFRLPSLPSLRRRAI